VTAPPNRLGIRCALRLHVAGRLQGMPRILHSIDHREDDAVDTDIEHLLDDPLAVLAAIHRDTHEGHHRRRQRAAFQDLPAVQHELK
jgi:hypothetical protein